MSTEIDIDMHSLGISEDDEVQVPVPCTIYRDSDHLEETSSDVACAIAGTGSQNYMNGNTLQNRLVLLLDVPLPPEFPFFLRYDSTPLTIYILQYLTAAELCILSNTSRSMYVAALSPALWKPLLCMDFVFEDSQLAAINSTPNDMKSVNESEIAASKAYYTKQVREVILSIERTREAKFDLDQEMVRDRYVKCAECCADFTMVRVVAPLPAFCTAATLVLSALRVDGYSVSVWVCLAPIMFLVVYMLFCAAVTYLVFKRRNQYSGIFRHEMWTNFRSPAQPFFEATSDSKKAVAGGLAVCILLLLQFVLLGLKLTTSSAIPENFHDGLYWGVVFLPMWLLMILYLISPAIGAFSAGPGPFFGLLTLVWVPMVILFVCLTVKLTGIENHKKEGRMRLALIMMPFWFLEGLFMLGSLAGLINGVYR